MKAASRFARVLLICTGSGLVLSCTSGERAGEATTADTAVQNPPVRAMVHDSLHATTSDSAAAGAPRAGDAATDGMAGMDHGTMAGMEHSGSTSSESAPAHAGHVAAPGSTGARGGARSAAAEHAGTSGMDHSAMAAGGRPMPPQSTTPAGGAGMAGMDHTGAVTRPQSPTARMSGMEHGAVPAVPAAIDSDARATTQLQTLVRVLLQDPQVRAAVQQDSALARRWSNDGVRRRLNNPGQ